MTTQNLSNLRRAWPSGSCPVCSYSLENLQAEICPECGTNVLEERARLDALRARRPRSPAIFWLFLGALFYIPSLRPLLLDAYRRGTDGEQRVGLLLCGAAAGWIVARLVILSMRALRKSPIPTSNGREALYALLTIPVYFVGYSLIVFSKRY